MGELIGAETVTLTGRSPLHAGIAQGLAAAVAKWVDDERARDTDGQGVASEETEAAMAQIAVHLSQLDVLSITLDGVREQLLGLRYDRGLVHDDADLAPDGTPRALAEHLPRLVAAGRLQVVSARLVDSWGRTLDLPLERAAVVARAVDRRRRPASRRSSSHRGITAPSRVHLRLVDPQAFDGPARTAVVDQVDAELMVNPVAGFILPDHIDEALELFDAAGTPLGQLSHDPFSDAVFWEGAPGRTDIGPAAGPLDDVDPAHRRLGWIAAGLVTSDAELRQATPARAETESPLSALLRAIDTTLWTVDPFGAMGTEHIAGLVGRPVAIVQAELTLDVPGDLDELVYAAGTSRDERARAFAELAAIPFPVRLGSLLRSDDGVLGYFVDDDYRRVQVVDRQVTQRALDSGRCRGLLGVTGETETKVIDSDYVVDAGFVTLRYGQTRRLTLLMHPGGKVHCRQGIAPRSSVALARDWVQPGLSVMAPSVRVGPLLIDADKVRLPKGVVVPRRPAVHPAARPWQLARRPDPRRHPGCVPARPAVDAAGGLDPDQSEPRRARRTPDGSLRVAHRARSGRRPDREEQPPGAGAARLPLCGSPTGRWPTFPRSALPAGADGARAPKDAPGLGIRSVAADRPQRDDQRTGHQPPVDEWSDERSADGADARRPHLRGRGGRWAVVLGDTGRSVDAARRVRRLPQPSQGHADGFGAGLRRHPRAFGARPPSVPTTRCSSAPARRSRTPTPPTPIRGARTPAATSSASGSCTPPVRRSATVAVRPGWRSVAR